MELIKNFGIIPIDFGTISNIIGAYKAPKDKIRKLEKAGKIIRLKKGLYIVSPEISNKALSKELIANHLLGPSYISLETALSYYGLIPERVYITKSVTTKRTKKITTPLGMYEYLSIPNDYFPIGVKNEIIENSYAFLIGSPEKVLCDLILTTSKLRIQSEKAMWLYLNEDLRIDFSSNPFQNFEIIKNCIEKGRKKRELKILYKVLKNG
ncbi:MAG: type IV toxin-antitoxin system AbiEi family antitoxin domain-containing protein [Prolixibacteraceae bacterium]